MTDTISGHRIAVTQVAIIGGGVIGCSIALQLVRRGAAATVIDGNGEVGHGSTSASCGIVRRFYSTPTMTAMAHEGASVWARWREHLREDESRDVARFERPGMLFIRRVIDEDVKRIVAHMREIGVDVELLSADEVAERFPFLDVASHSPVRRPEDDDFFEPTGRRIAGGVYEPDSGYVISPHLATLDLRAAGEREGVRFRLGQRVSKIQREEGGFRLQLEDGSELSTEALVNAAGPHSVVVNRLAGATLPTETRPLRREVHAVGNPRYTEEGGAAVPVVGDLDSGVYFRPEGVGQDLVVGSVEPECDTLEWVDDPDEHDESCTPEGFERQVLRLMKRFPDVQLGGRRGIAGLYDVSVLDWNPVLDKTDVPGYYVAIGTSGSSFKTAPVIGAVMAELIDACQGGRDHDRDSLKITLPNVGFEVDMAFFSRLRGAHSTSGTVLA